MPYIKLLTALAGLALLTACGGTPTAKGDPAQTTDCAANPFGASCIAEDINVEARITDCITAGNAGDTKCASLTSDTAMNTAINTCLTNPFDDTCTASDFTFSTYADTARTNRVSFCGMTGNAGNALCTALTTCQANPFGATCGVYFEPTRITHCETNDVVVCPNVTTADWLASFTAGTAPPATPDATTRKDEFLAATATGFNTGANADIRATFDSPTTDIAIQTLTFAEANTATGGVAFFGGELYTAGTSTGTDFYYAGVLAGTDLGAPITENITSAKWTGQIRANANIDGAEILALAGADFELDITFDGAKGTMKTIFARGPQFVYEIDGMFDENGIITGSVDYGAGDTTSGINMASSVSSFYSPGTLTGIIGQNGAVGAFHSNNNTGVDQASFSGGFVALPPRLVVNTADWLASFGDTPPPATVALATANTDIRSLFLSVGTNGVIDSAGLTSAISATLSRDGDADDGVTYVIGTIESVTHSFVGLLPSTDLGAPLPSTTADATWGGSYYAGPNSGTNDITFNIDFGAGTIDATDTKLRIRTTFDLDFTATGVITGDVNFGNVDDAPDIAQARGLIGEQGLVGGFVNTDGGTYSGELYGGFVAAPPDPCVKAETCVNTADWLASFTGNDALPATVALATANTAIRSHFLSIGADGVIDRVGLTGTITSDTLSRAGDADDGVTYVEGDIESVTQSFVGLLPSTNLGAPLPSTTADATWVGSYYTRLNNANHPITFNIDFGAGTIDATDTQASLTTIFDLDFTATGVITGDVSVEDDTAQARGLIGEQGLVGGFANTDGEGDWGSSLYGGFVARKAP